MYSIYKARSHTKKQRGNRKQKLTEEEREKRNQQKQIAKSFPSWKCFLPCYKKTFTVKNHQLRKTNSVTLGPSKGANHHSQV